MNDLNSRVFFHSDRMILDLLHSQPIPELNNVVEGFENDFYGIALSVEDSLQDYILTYIGNYNELAGISLNIGREIENRDRFTLKFSKIIEQEFPETNQLTVFNTFQQKTKELYETLGVFCVSEYVARIKNASFILPRNKNSIDYIPLIDILNFYRNIFYRDVLVNNTDKQPKVYLMYDKRFDKIKIGNTYNRLQVRRKGVAEKTKRAVDPLIEVISAWEAPKNLEDILHDQYKNKRQRGEWFDLRASDLEKIDQFTSKYEMIDITT